MSLIAWEVRKYLLPSSCQNNPIIGKCKKPPNIPLLLSLPSNLFPSHLTFNSICLKQTPARPPKKELNPPQAAEVGHTHPDVVNLREK